MIILEVIEAPTTLEERISMSKVEVERLNRLLLNATTLIPLAFVLTMATAVGAGFLVDQLGMVQAVALIPPLIVGGTSLPLAFRNFDRKSDAYLKSAGELRELKAEARQIAAKMEVSV